MRNFTLRFVLFLAILVCSNAGFTQLVSGNAFLKGQYLEVGMSSCGTFGSSVSPPTGYHPNGDFRLGFVADVGKDGWTTGLPPFIGDYFVPGSPVEGFAIEINGINYVNMSSNSGICALNSVFGSVTNVNNSGSTVTSTWEGSIGNLAVKQTVEFDTNTVFFAVSVELTNTGASSLNDVFYMRNVDPDNEVPQGGSFITTNEIVSQNPSTSNIALVKATGLTYGSILALGSEDARARVSHGGFNNFNASSVYNATGLNGSGIVTADQAISIAFDIGDLSPSETSCLTFFYMFDETEYATALSSASQECIDLLTYGIPENICPTDSFFVSFNLDTANVLPLAGNQFIVELSDSLGSFVTPTILATTNTVSVPVDSIYLGIPSSIVYGDKYRIRVRTTAPIEIGADNGYDLTIGFPQPNFGPTTITCSGNPTTLSVDLGAQFYVWSNGGTTNSINVSTSGTYSVTVLNGGCLDTFSTAVTAQLSPIFILQDTFYSCNSDSTLVTAGAGYPQYSWSTGSITNSTYVNESGYVYCTVAGLSGCTKTDSTFVNRLDARISLSSDSICGGTETALSAELVSSCLNFLSLTSDDDLTVDIESLINDDYGSIAVTPNYIYYTGDLATVRLNADDLSSPVQFLQRQGLFSDLADGSLYTFWNPNFNSFTQNNITTLRKLNTNLSFVSDITLSQTIIAGNGRNGLFVGNGEAFLFSSSTDRFYSIDLSNGQVTDLGLYSSFEFTLPFTEGWAFYGIAQCDEDGTAVIMKNNSSNAIVSFSLTNSTYTTLESYSSSISELSSITYSPWNGYWYYQIEGSSVLGTGAEVLGKAKAQLGSDQLEYNWSTGDSANSIIVNPLSTSVYSLTISNDFFSCSSSETVFVVGNSPVSLSDTVYSCHSNIASVEADSGYASYVWNTGETGSSISPSYKIQKSTVQLIDSFGCEYEKRYTYFDFDSTLSVSVDPALPICDGEVSLFPFPYSSCNELVDIDFNDFTIQELFPTISADRGGLVVTEDHVFYVANSNVVRTNKEFGSVTTLPLTRALVSNVQTNQIFNLADTTGGAPFGIVNALVERNINMIAIDTIPLTSSVSIGSSSGIFTGQGYIIVYSEFNQQLTKIDLQTGEVEFLLSVNLSLPNTEEFAIYGLASCDSLGQYQIIYSSSSFTNSLTAFNLGTFNFSNITVANQNTGLLEGLAFSPLDGRVYFHIEFNSNLFGTGQQRLGYGTANYISNGIEYTWNNGFNKAIQTTSAANVSSLNLNFSKGSFSCDDSLDINVLPPPSFSLNDTTITCFDTNTVISAPVSALISSYLWSTGETSPSISPTLSGTYSVTVNDTNGCTSSASTVFIPVDANITASSLASCNGDTVTLSVNDDLTGYSFSELLVDNISTIDVNSFSGDNRGSIATTPTHVFYTGDNATVRLNNDLTGITSLPRTDRLFSDLKTGQLYSFDLSTTTTNVRVRNSSMGIQSTINLSQSIFAANLFMGIYSGYGFVVIGAWQGTNLFDYYKIELPSGLVTPLGSSITTPISADFTFAGIALEKNAGMEIIYRPNQFPNNFLNVQNVVTGTDAVFQDYGIDMGQVDAIAISPWTNKWFVHHEFNSILFGNGAEVLASMDASFLGPKSVLWSTGDTTNQIRVAPTSTSTYSVVVTYESLTCNDSATIAVATSTPLTLPDTIVSCFDTVQVNISNTYLQYSWSTGDVSNSIVVDSAQVITVDVLDSNLCPLSDETYVYPAHYNASSEFPGICSGDSLQLSVNTSASACPTNINFGVTGSQIVSPNFTFDDWSGIAITDQYLFVTSDFSTIRFDKNNLALQTNLTWTSGIFSDLESYKLYRFTNSTSNSFNPNSTVSYFAELDDNLNVLSYTALSAPIPFSNGSGVYAGQGFVIVNVSSGGMYHIDLNTGDVTILLNFALSTQTYPSEGWANYGVAFCSNSGGYDLYYRPSSGASSINKFNTESQITSVVFTSPLGSLGDMYQFTISADMNRWYFSYEFSSVTFGGGSENIGFANATLDFGGNFNHVWSTTQTGDMIKTLPTTDSTYYVVSTIYGNTCTDSVSIILATKPLLDLDSLYAGCSSDGVTITLPPSNFILWEDGDTSTTRTFIENQTIWAQIADTLGCWARDTAAIVALNSTINSTSVAVCNSDPVILFASPDEAQFQLNILTTGGTTAEISSIIGDDNGGIAITPKHVFINGDNAVVRLDANSLTNPTSFSFNPSIFSDLKTGKLYKFWNSSTGAFDNQINAIVELDSNMNTLNTIPLSQSINLNTFPGARNGVFAGLGIVILYNNSNSNLYIIDLVSGETTVIQTFNLNTTFYNGEAWAIYGTAEYENGSYSVRFRNSSSNTLSRFNLQTTAITSQSITSLNDMYNFTYSPWLQKWFGSYESSGFLGFGAETAFSANALEVSSYNYLWSTGATTRSISVSPTSTTTYFLTTSIASDSCYDSITLSLPSVITTLGIGDTIISCDSVVTINLPSGFSNPIWSTGQTSNSIDVSSYSSLSVAALDSFGCARNTSSLVWPLNASLTTQNGACIGDATGAKFNYENKCLEVQTVNATSPLATAIFSQTGDDNTGMAITPDFLFVSGDFGCAKLNASDLSVVTSINVPWMNFIFSDLSDGQVYAMWNTPGSTNPSSFDILLVLDDNLQSIDTITLSMNIPRIGVSALFAGTGFNIIGTNGTFYKIDLSDGNVSILNGNNSVLNTSSINAIYPAEGWASYGVAECGFSGYNLLYRSFYGQYIVKYDLMGGSILSTYFFSNLNDMGMFTVSPWESRWYGSCENSSQFLSASEHAFSALITANDPLFNLISWNNGSVGDTATYLLDSTSTLIDVSLGASCSSCPSCDFSDTIIVDTAVVTTTTLIAGNACSNTNLGSASVFISGSSAPYSYLWSNGDTSNTADSLAGGMSYVSVTNSSGCVVVDSILIPAPAPLVTVQQLFPPTCDEDTNGSVTLTVTGPSPTYTFLWNTGSTTSYDSNLIAGTYSVTITDTAGCQFLRSYTLPQSATPSTPSPITVSTAEVCAGAPVTLTAFSGLGTGTITTFTSNTPTQSTFTSGATLVYEFYNLPNVFTETAILQAFYRGDMDGVTEFASYYSEDGSLIGTSDPTAGCGTFFGSKSFNITAALFNSWNANDTVTITVVTEDAVDLCSPKFQGYLRFNYIQGSQTYWFTDSCIANRSLAYDSAASFTITPDSSMTFYAMNYSGGCWSACNSASFTVKESAELTVNLDTINLCELTSVNLKAQGADAVFWTPSNGLNLVVGDSVIASPTVDRTYTAYGQNLNGCLDTVQFRVNVNESLYLSDTSIQNQLCFGGNIGSIAVEVDGGNEPYSYTWNTGSNIDSIGGLSSGTYWVYAEDTIGQCRDTFFLDVTEPNALEAILNISNISCNGSTDGAIGISFIGGSAPYSWVWEGGSTGDSISGLAPGFYAFTATDANGCGLIDSIEILEPDSLLASNSKIQDAFCNTVSNGAAFATHLGGTGAITYLWDNGSTNDSVSNLNIGNHWVVITDSNNCFDTSFVSISNQFPDALASIDSTFDVLCFGDSNGRAYVSGSGTGPFSFDWTYGPSMASNLSLPEGTYAVTATDSVGCFDTVSFAIAQPDPLIFDALITQNLICFDDSSGSIMASVLGGASPYSYLWTNGSDSSSAQSLDSGSYSVIVSDVNGCEIDSTMSIGQPLPMTITLDSLKNNLCFGDSLGSIFTSVQNNQGAFFSLWNTSDTLLAIDSLASNTYSLLVTDSAGCIASDTFIVDSPAMLSMSFIVDSIDCSLDSSATVSVITIGGVSPYTYNWFDGSDNDSVSNLAAGVYSLSVMDANSCQLEDSISVIDGDTLQSLISIVASPQCLGDSTGIVTVQAFNGTAPYSFAWSNGSVNDTVSNLPSDKYYVTLTDAKGCIEVDSIELNIVNSSFAISIDSLRPLTCFLSDDGFAQISVSGTNSPFSYLWPTGDTSLAVDSLISGNYIVSVTDAIGCSDTININIISPDILTVIFDSIANINCFGDSSGAIYSSGIGGNADYVFNWSSGETNDSISNLTSGIYTLSISDNKGCTAVDSITIIDSYPSLSVSSIESNPTCFGLDNGSIQLNVTGGTGTYSIVWSNGDDSVFVDSLLAGVYSYTITDSLSCNYSDSITLVNPDSITSAVSLIDPVICNDDTNASLIVFANGGTAPLQYLWNNNDTDTLLSFISGGTYIVSITDANACLKIDSLVVYNPSPLSVGLDSLRNISCTTDSNGYLSFAPFGGVGTYSYLWNTSDTNLIQDSLQVGTYSFSVTDSLGCIADTLITLNFADSLFLSILDSVDVSCFNGNDGVVTLNVISGSAVNTFLWNGTSGIEYDSNLVAGTFQIVAQNNLCSDSATVQISQPDSLFTTLDSLADLSCFQSLDGFISITSVGGVSPYSFAWSSGQSDSLITSIDTGTYVLTVTDANSCIVIDTYAIAQPDSMFVVLDSFLNASCDASIDNGYANVSVTGGSMPYLYNWSNGSDSSTIVDLATGTYNLTITDFNGCNAAFSHIVVRDTVPIVSLPALNPTCESVDSIILSGGLPLGGVFSGIGVINDVFLPNIAGSGDFTITYTFQDANGCADSASSIITVDSVPQVVFDSIPVVCKNVGSIQLTQATPLGGVYFGTGVSGNSFDPQLSDTGTFEIGYAIATTGGCSDTAYQFVTVQEFPELSFIDTSITCANGLPFQLTGGSPLGGIYFGTGVTNDFFNPSQAGESTVQVGYTYQDVCGIDTVYHQILVNPFPTPSLIGNAVLCENDSLLLETTESYSSYLWSDGSTDARLIAGGASLASIEGAVSITVTNEFNCQNLATINVELLDTTPLNLADTTICHNSNLALSSPAAATYLWNTGDTSRSIVVYDSNGIRPETLEFSLQLTASNGCISKDSVTINVINCDSTQDLGYHNLYPNPTNDLFVLEFFASEDQEVQIQVYDATGKLVMSRTQQASSGKNWSDFNGARFGAGIFLVRMFVDDILISEKVVVN